MPPPVVAEPAGAEGAAPVLPPGGELPIEGKTVKALTLLSLKRTYDLFVGNHGQKPGLDEDSQKLKIACKVCQGLAGGMWAVGCKGWAGAAPPAPLIAPSSVALFFFLRRTDKAALLHDSQCLSCLAPTILTACRCGTSMRR